MKVSYEEMTRNQGNDAGFHIILRLVFRGHTLLFGCPELTLTYLPGGVCDGEGWDVTLTSEGQLSGPCLGFQIPLFLSGLLGHIAPQSVTFI